MTTSITTRAGKGSPLTHAEVDANFTNLQTTADAALPLAGGTMTGPVTMTGGTVTTSTPLIDATQTWNAAGVTFTGWKLNVTDTASASGSKLVDWQVGGTSVSYIKKSGVMVVDAIALQGETSSYPAIQRSGNAIMCVMADFSDMTGFNCAGAYAKGGGQAEVAIQRGSGVLIGSTLKVRWSSTTAYGGTADTGISRNAAGIVEINDSNAGTFRDLKLRNLLAGGGNGSYIQTPSMTVANLASAATAGAGARAFVTDATATTFLSTVAGGGSNKVPVVSDGTNWLIG